LELLLVCWIGDGADGTVVGEEGILGNGARWGTRPWPWLAFLERSLRISIKVRDEIGTERRRRRHGPWEGGGRGKFSAMIPR